PFLSKLVLSLTLASGGRSGTWLARLTVEVLPKFSTIKKTLFKPSSSLTYANTSVSFHT
uniref:Uncharacterized protein n=1 Tax=Callorhinchus milii TaxID=7868 RepID=A0A4W3H1S1_CALMI